MTVFALLGATALWLLYAWLLMAIIASYLSERKGYTEKPGLACGLLLHVVGVVIWLFWPAKPHSKWKSIGPVGRAKPSHESHESREEAA
jgi:fucose permease